MILPDDGRRLAVEMSVDREIYADSFGPLPRDREVLFAVESQQKAKEQKRFREALAEDLGKQIATKLVELAESQDTRNG